MCGYHAIIYGLKNIFDNNSGRIAELNAETKELIQELISRYEDNNPIKVTDESIDILQQAILKYYEKNNYDGQTLKEQFEEIYGADMEDHPDNRTYWLKRAVELKIPKKYSPTNCWLRGTEIEAITKMFGISIIVFLPNSTGNKILIFNKDENNQGNVIFLINKNDHYDTVKNKENNNLYQKLFPTNTN